MKKLLAVILTVAMVFAFTACGGGSSEDEKNSILKGKPRIPPIVSSWRVHGRKTRCDLLPQEQARLQPAGTHRQRQAGVCGEKKPHQAFVS